MLPVIALACDVADAHLVTSTFQRAPQPVT